MEEDNNEEGFEKITLTNVWIKEHILDLMTKIEKNEIIAYNGSDELIDMFQMNGDQILSMKLNAFNLMRSHVQTLLHNVQPQLDKAKTLKLKIILSRINNNQGSFIRTFVNELTHYDTYCLTEDFYDALDNLSYVKSELIMQIADKEILMPKKASGKDEKIVGDIEDD